MKFNNTEAYIFKNGSFENPILSMSIRKIMSLPNASYKLFH